MAAGTFAVRTRKDAQPGEPVPESDAVAWERFGQAVVDARIDQRMTRKDLARRARVSYSTLQRIEAGKQPACPFDTMLRIATALDRSLNDLLAGSVDTKRFRL